jgi:hypothetical protein
MRGFIHRRLGGTEYTARVHGTSRSELRGVYAVQPVPRSYGLIDNVKSASVPGSPNRVEQENRTLARFSLLIRIAPDSEVQRSIHF